MGLTRFLLSKKLTNEIEKAIDMLNKFIENEETLNLNKELESILLLLLSLKDLSKKIQEMFQQA
jgi:hypothetical protein